MMVSNNSGLPINCRHKYFSQSGLLGLYDGNNSRQTEYMHAQLPWQGTLKKIKGICKFPVYFLYFVFAHSIETETALIPLCVFALLYFRRHWQWHCEFMEYCDWIFKFPVTIMSSLHTMDVRVTKVSWYKCFHFLLMCSTRQRIANS